MILRVSTSSSIDGGLAGSGRQQPQPRIHHPPRALLRGGRPRNAAAWGERRGGGAAGSSHTAPHSSAPRCRACPASPAPSGTAQLGRSGPGMLLPRRSSRTKEDRDWERGPAHREPQCIADLTAGPFTGRRGAAARKEASQTTGLVKTAATRCAPGTAPAGLAVPQLRKAIGLRDGYGCDGHCTSGER